MSGPDDATDDDGRVVPLRQALEDAQLVEREPPPDPAPPPDDSDGGGGARARKTGRRGLPRDCPVTPLGHQANVYSYLHTSAEIRPLAGGKHTRGELQSLFSGAPDWPRENYPRFAKGTDGEGNPIVNGIRYDDLSMDLMAACASKGIFNSSERVRSVGWWPGEDGGLVCHCGDALLLVDRDGRETWRPPGMIGNHVYTGAEPAPRPVPGVAGPQDMHELLGLVRSWAWSEPDLGPVLLLGWAGCGVLGAALPWRPVAWITGGSGTGKSTLKDRFLEPLLQAPAGAVSVADATEAGLRQSLRQMSVPAIVDELEAESDHRKADAIVRLARLAAGGGVIRRGGQDHAEVVFQVRSAFLFQSIVVPGLSPQDRSRIAILELGPLADRRMPDLDARRLGWLGAALRRRLIQAWPRLPQTLERYQETLRAAGPEAMDARGAALYSALLAVAELLLYDDPEEMDPWFRALPERLQAQVRAEREGAGEGDEFLAHLLSSTIEASRGATPITVAALIRSAARADDDAHRARQALGLHGLRVCPYPWPKEVAAAMPPEIRDIPGLVVANRSTGLARLLANTRWTAESGKQPPWCQVTRALAQAHRGQATPRTSWRFAGFQARGPWIPLAGILGEGEGDD